MSWHDFARRVLASGTALACSTLPLVAHARLLEPPTPAEPAPAQPAPAQPASWAERVTIQRCSSPTLELPAQTESALDATLLVRVPGGIGSAVLISPDGFALTAAHVVETHPTVTLVSHDGAELTGEVLRVDEVQDIALIKVAVAGPSACLELASGRLPVGSDVFVLGSPAGEELSFSVSKGIISGYRSLDGSHFVQLDAAVNPGNSGGPAVSQSGAVVGIASWKVAAVSMEGLSFAVPSDVALAALEIDIGETSSTQWRDLGGRRNAAGPTENPATPLVGLGPEDPKVAQRKKLRTALILPGSLVLGVGVVAVGITGGLYEVTDEMTQANWTTLQITNTIGWAMAGVGAAALIVGLVIPKRPKNAGAPELSLLPTASGALVHGRF